jgi:glycosyltransferase involved in cell wall biosynthesis
MKLFGISGSRLRLIIILLLQNNAFRNARGVIFLTKYASKVIQNSCGALKNYKVIPHGIGDEFRGIFDYQKKFEKTVIKCIYVSNTALYKYQWNVVKAIEMLRNSGFNVEIDLIGGGEGRAKRKLDSQIKLSDPKGEFVREFDFVSNSELPNIFRRVDIFIFASGCENMPVTLLEGMSSGLPIVCSQRGPMPEVLKDGGLYFNPEDPADLAESLKQIILNPQLAFELSRRAMTIANKYTWKRCSEETFAYLINNIKR